MRLGPARGLGLMAGVAVAVKIEAWIRLAVQSRMATHVIVVRP